MTRIGTREQQKARDIYQGNMVGGCAFSLVGVVLLQLALFLALQALEALTAMPFRAVGRAAGTPLLIGSLVLLSNIALPRYATRQVQKAGLSQERQIVESLEGAGDSARRALHDQTPYEVLPEPSPARRWLKHGGLLLLWAIPTTATVFFWHDPATGLLLRVVAGGGSVLVLGLILLSLHSSLRRGSRLRIDCEGIQATPFFKTCGVRWEDVATLDIVTRFNVLGECLAVQYQFKDAAGETRLLLSNPLLTSAQSDAVTNFLRCVCSGQPAPVS